MTIDLSKKENWTPLMIHIHRTALLVGVALGFIEGALFVMLAGLLVLKFWYGG